VSSAEPLFQEYYLMPGVQSGAIWRHSSAERKPFHFHGHLEFLLVTRGHAVERIGNRTHPIHAGQLVWHLPSIPHEMSFASADLDMRVVHAEPDLAGAMCGKKRGAPSGALDASLSSWVKDLGWLAAGDPVVELRRADVDRLLEDCDSTFDDLAPITDEGPRLSRLLQNAWGASLSNRHATPPSSLSELASCLLIEDPALDRSAICKMLDVSEGYLSRTFQAELGTSFVHQRARVRVSRFVDQVERGGQNLLEAALAAGFGSYSQLHRTFSELVAMSPVAYLRQGGRAARASLTRT
jgi:AraC-like DNA-binding protein